MFGAEPDSMRLFDKELGQLVEVPLTAVDLEMTPKEVVMPTPPSWESEKDVDRATDSASPYEEVRHK